MWQILYFLNCFQCWVQEFFKYFSVGLERWFSGWEQRLLLQNWVRFPAPTWKLQVFATHPGDPMPSSGPQKRCIHPVYRHVSGRNTHPHELEKKTNVKHLTMHTISRTFDVANLKLWAYYTSCPNSRSWRYAFGNSSHFKEVGGVPFVPGWSHSALVHVVPSQDPFPLKALCCPTVMLPFAPSFPGPPTLWLILHLGSWFLWHRYAF